MWEECWPVSGTERSLMNKREMVGAEVGEVERSKVRDFDGPWDVFGILV